MRGQGLRGARHEEDEADRDDDSAPGTNCIIIIYIPRYLVTSALARVQDISED